MKYVDGYVLVSITGKGVVWQGRTARPAKVVCEPFEETFAQAGDGDWVVTDMPAEVSGLARVRGVPFIAATLREAWLWVAGGEPCAVAPVSYGDVRAIAMRSEDGRIAVIAQCEEPALDL